MFSCPTILFSFKEKNMLLFVLFGEHFLWRVVDPVQGRQAEGIVCVVCSPAGSQWEQTHWTARIREEAGGEVELSTHLLAVTVCHALFLPSCATTQLPCTAMTPHAHSHTKQAPTSDITQRPSFAFHGAAGVSVSLQSVIAGYAAQTPPAPRANVLKLAVAARRGGPAGGTAVRLAGGQLDMAAPLLSSPTAA